MELSGNDDGPVTWKVYTINRAYIMNTFDRGNNKNGLRKELQRLYYLRNLNSHMKMFSIINVSPNKI